MNESSLGLTVRVKKNAKRVGSLTCLLAGCGNLLVSLPQAFAGCLLLLAGYVNGLYVQEEPAVSCR